MRTVALLLLAAWTALPCVETRYRTKREELLLRAKRRWVLSTIEVTEEDPGPFPKLISQMYNDKLGTVDSHLFVISGSGVTEEPLGVFSIDENNGKVWAHKPVDREKKSLFHIKFDILDKKTRVKIDKELAFDVEIKDINDNDPIFLRSRIIERIKENVEEGFLPVQLQSVDPDQPNSPNSTMTITMVSQNPTEPKIEVEKIDDRTAQLKFSGCFDYDKVKKYDIIAKVEDHGTPRRSSTASITLLILDANTHLPTFTQTEYKGQVNEMAIVNDILRVAVEDKDKPNTPGWLAKYFFISGNEDGNYEIETDPKTNEGIISVIKGKDFERTTNTTLQIGVENMEPLFFCKNNPGQPPKPNTANITITIIDVNDPPYFDKASTDVYQQEEEPPGKVIYTSKVTDVDSDMTKIRYVLLDDPAGWMKIDPKTGIVSTVKKMDRESPFVNDKNVYKILVGAIDDGVPPATGTGTVLIHLKDINDHKPMLLNSSAVLCADSANKVPLKVQDLDAHPYSGPFAFALDEEDQKLKEYWTLDPAFGDEGGLVMIKTLAYSNYSIPLIIQDQQNMISKETILVVVCECGEAGVCLKQPLTVNVGGAVIGLILGSLLLFLLLLLAFVCHCGKRFQKLPSSLVDEGNQTLIMYNQEGGSSECKAEPSLFLKTTTDRNIVIETNGQKPVQPRINLPTDEVDMYDFFQETIKENKGTLSRPYPGGPRGNGIYNTDTWQYKTWQGSSRYSHYSLQVNQYISDHLHRKLQLMSGAQGEEVEYQPYEYAYEGKGSISQSLDQLSLGNLDDVQFLNDLGPKFKTLGGICKQAIEEKNTQF